MKTSGLIATLTFACTATLALASCAGGTEGIAASGEQLKVAVTTTQLADFAAEIGGEDIELTSLLAPGGSAHHFEPTPGDLLRLGQADVLVVNGAGLDDFVDNSIEASGFSGTIIDASAGIDLDMARAITAEALEGQNHAGEHSSEGAHTDTDGHEHDDEPAGSVGHAHGEAEAGHATSVDADLHGGDTAAEAEHDDHDHGDLNPHLWTSPRFAQGMVQHITDGLAAADPEHKNDYLERSSAYQEKLATLDDWISAQFNRIPAEDRVLVTGHDSLRYYLHDYEIAYAGSLLPSFEDNAEPSAAEIDALVKAIKKSGVQAIFVESSLSPKLAKTVAKEAGVTVVDADSLYADSLGPVGSGAETYIDATVHNTRLILEAWGATVEPEPSELVGS